MRRTLLVSVACVLVHETYSEHDQKPSQEQPRAPAMGQQPASDGGSSAQDLGPGEADVPAHERDRDERLQRPGGDAGGRHRRDTVRRGCGDQQASGEFPVASISP